MNLKFLIRSFIITLLIFAAMASVAAVIGLIAIKASLPWMAVAVGVTVFGLVWRGAYNALP